LSCGSSFLQALKAKYTSDATSLVSESDAKQYSRRNLADIEVEAPNMEGVIRRSAQLHKLREVGLGGWRREADSDGTFTEAEDYADVARAFDNDAGEEPGDIKKTCPNVRGLDLSRSLLPSWLEMSRIAVELPLLESLLLHFNRFADLSPSSMPLPNAFSRLRDLRIDGTLLKWQDVLRLADALPSLESLQMGSNGVSRLNGSGTLSTGRLNKLKVLNLEGNHLSDWNDVWPSMEACPSLQRLILSSNKLTSISIVDRADQKHRVRHISLWDNAISSWSDVDALDASVGGLESLVTGGDSCVLTREMPMQDVRLITIARLPHLQSFNNAPVLAVERREAELYYISIVEKESLSEENRSQLHPRWSHLCQIHGITKMELNGKHHEDSSSNGTLRNKLLSISVHLSSQPPVSQPPYIFPAPDIYPTQQVVLNLLTTTPLRLLKSKLARSFSLRKGPQAIQSIWALLSPTLDPTQSTAQLLRSEMRPQETAPSNERIVFEMDSLERNLHGYNFSNGDEIVVVVGLT
jgi:hypothetical protein